MSKKKKQERAIIIALIAVFAVICIAYFATMKYKEAKEKAASTSVNLLKLDSSMASKIELDNENGKVIFEKSGDSWVIPDKADFKVKERAINTLLDEFADLTATKCVVNDKDTIAEYGLDKPSATATLTLSDGTKVVFSLGNQVPLGGGYYGMLESSDGVYTFDSESVSSVQLGEDNFEDSATEETESPETTDSVTTE